MNINCHICLFSGYGKCFLYKFLHCIAAAHHQFLVLCDGTENICAHLVNFSDENPCVSTGLQQSGSKNKSDFVNLRVISHVLATIRSRTFCPLVCCLKT
jgi:hypothetical protein